MLLFVFILQLVFFLWFCRFTTPTFGFSTKGKQLTNLARAVKWDYRVRTNSNLNKGFGIQQGITFWKLNLNKSQELDRKFSSRKFRVVLLMNGAVVVGLNKSNQTKNSFKKLTIFRCQNKNTWLVVLREMAAHPDLNLRSFIKTKYTLNEIQAHKSFINK